MVSRRGFHRAVLLGACAVSAPLVQVQAQPERPRVTVAVGARESFNHLPLAVAMQLGYFKAEGLDVDIQDAASVSGATPAQVFAGAYTQTIRMQGQKQYLRAFAMQSLSPMVALGIAPAALEGASLSTQLRGKRIGVPSSGALSVMLAHLMVARAGLGNAGVSWVELSSPANAAAALRAGQIDAISNCDPIMTTLEQRGEVKVIADARTLKSAKQLFGGAIPSACLYAGETFVQSYPATCQALTNGVVRALKWLQTAGPSDIIKTVPEAYLQGDRSVYLACFAKARESFATDAVLPEDGPRIALKTVTEYEPALKGARVDLARTFTNDFALRAKARFRA